MTDEEFRNAAHSLEQHFSEDPDMDRNGFETFLTNNAYLTRNMAKTFVRRYLKEGQDENLKAALRREFSET